MRYNITIKLNQKVLQACVRIAGDFTYTIYGVLL